MEIDNLTISHARPDLTVHAIGTPVTVGGDIPAVIRGVTIYSEYWVKYCCVWWDERSRREEWLTADEIHVQSHSRTTVAFK